MVMEDGHSGDGHGSRPLCGAKLRQGGGTCRRPAGAGTPHSGTGRCPKHGGSTRTQVVGAERQQVEAEARRLFDKIAPDVVPVDNPLEAYAQFAGRVMAWLALMDALLGDLDSPRYKGVTAEQIRGEVLLFERAMDRANTVLSSYARLNIDERLVRVNEQQSALVVAAVEAGLAAIGVTGTDAFTAKRAVARHLRALPPTEPDGA